jgi:hypothetical protein
MKLRAEVAKPTGATKHYKGFIANGEPVPINEMGTAKRVEIVEDEGCFYLYRYDAAGVCVGDTWHMTIDEAKAQAEFEFRVGATDWKEAD